MTANPTDFEKLMAGRCCQLEQELELVVDMMVKFLNGDVNEAQIASYIKWNFPAQSKKIRK